MDIPTTRAFPAATTANETVFVSMPHAASRFLEDFLDHLAYSASGLNSRVRIWPVPLCGGQNCAGAHLCPAELAWLYGQARLKETPLLEVRIEGEFLRS